MAAAPELSYLHTRPLEPHNYTTITRVAKENARLYPDQEILVLRGLDGSRETLTNAELYQQATKLAKYLVSVGIQKGDMIALIGPNTLEMVVAMIGIMCAGGIVLNATINMKKAVDAKELFEITDTKFVLVDCGKNNSLLEPVKAMLQYCKAPTDESKNSSQTGVIFLREVEMGGFQDIETLQAIQQKNIDDIILPDVYPEDPAMIFTTSGSTGKPKMVLHTHFNFASYPFSWTPLEVDYDIIDYNDRPFSWIGGSPVFHIIARKKRVFMDASVAIQGHNTQFLWNVLREEKCTDALLFPYVIIDLVDLPPDVPDDGFRLQHVSTGGQMIDNFYTRVIGRYCHKFIVVYGCTESIGIACRGPVVHGETLEAGDVGQPYSSMEIRIVDEHEHPVPVGTVGKVQVRTPVVMREYYGIREKTEESFTKAGWFRSGDVGKVSDGNLILLGRETDIISRGTRKIYPGMLEDLIKQMSSIRYVSVVPVPDKRLYEEICVCFVASGSAHITPDDVKKFCKEYLFDKSTVDSMGEMPTYFLRFEDFPTLDNGKPNKIAIKLKATERLGLAHVRE